MNPLHLTLVASLIGYAGVTAARVILSLYALRLGAQPAQIGILMALSFAFPLLLSWPIGVWADRIGSRGLLLLGFTAGAAGMLIAWFTPSLPAIYAAGALAGAAFVFCNVLAQNLVGLLSKAEERARNFSNASLMGSISNVAGPLIAGFAIDHFSYAMACLASGGLFVVAFLLIALWGARLPGGSRARTARAKTSLRGWLSDRAMLAIMLTTSMVQLGQDMFMFYLPIYGHDIGLSASAIGSILAAYALASSLIRLVLPLMVKRLGEERMLAITFAVAALGFAMLPLFENPWMLGIIAFGFGLGFGCGMPVTMMLLFARAPAGRSGETIGMRQTVNNFVRVVSPPVFGAIASSAGLLAVFMLSAVLMGAIGWTTRPRAPRAS